MIPVSYLVISNLHFAVPEPWKMPYDLQNKKLIAKIALIVGTVTCILSFLTAILVMITRLPFLKLLQLIFCLLGGKLSFSSPEWKLWNLIHYLTNNSYFIHMIH